MIKIGDMEKIYKLIEHMIYTGISLLILARLQILIKYLVNKYRNDNDYSNYKVSFNYIGNYIKLDLVSFDGYNYEFILKVDAFKAIPNEILKKPNYKDIKLHIKKEDIALIDILKIMISTKVKLTKKTSSNIIRILYNKDAIG